MPCRPQIFYAPDLLLTTKVDPMAALNLGAHILPPTQRTVKVQEGLLYTAKGVYPEVRVAEMVVGVDGVVIRVLIYNIRWIWLLLWAALQSAAASADCCSAA
jgi:hypothetical protein